MNATPHMKNTFLVAKRIVSSENVKIVIVLCDALSNMQKSRRQFKPYPNLPFKAPNIRRPHSETATGNPRVDGSEEIKKTEVEKSCVQYNSPPLQRIPIVRIENLERSRDEFFDAIDRPISSVQC